MKPFAICMALCAAFLAPISAHAFCGFYVAGADANLVNKATMVVLMRDGTRTVLSMQNNYEGPAENFAMVIPVPVVLQEENVKVLKDEVFERVDHLAAPRLVEYWEIDPCYVEPPAEEPMALMAAPSMEGAQERAPGGSHGVTIEAQFAVGEYEIVILSAQDSTGLDAWLRENEYSIPEGAEPVLRPYVEAGMKFFVAKVNVEEVQFVDGRAELSPLRFHYDSEQLSLPVRLGLLNSAGKQDLIVHILARNQRYELANYENVTIPTNLDVSNEVRTRFGEFYAALFDETLTRTPRAIITEYSWQATNCDPCPGPVLSAGDIVTLGADVLPSLGQLDQNGWEFQGQLNDFVLTRLHARYDRELLTEDLVFRAASPIVGGREFPGPSGKVEQGAQPAGANNFQARYAIRHQWTGPIECDNPVRGRWGGPPAGAEQPGTKPATDLAFAPRGSFQLSEALRQDVPELGITAAAAAVGATQTPTEATTAQANSETESSDSSCTGCAVSEGGPIGGFIMLMGLGWMLRRRR